MKYKLNRNASGEAVSASVTLTEKERLAVLGGQVPWIYSPGGMGPERPTDSATINFGGACYVDTERCLLACLAAFRVAVAAELKRQSNWRRRDKRALQDEAEGFAAFPGGRLADALRGTKSFPNNIRCPFKRADRVAAWQCGYDRAMQGVYDAAYEDAA